MDIFKISKLSVAASYSQAGSITALEKQIAGVLTLCIS